MRETPPGRRLRVGCRSVPTELTRRRTTALRASPSSACRCRSVPAIPRSPGCPSVPDRATTTLGNRVFERARRTLLLVERKADGGAALGEQVDDASANAAGAAGDNGDPTLQRKVRKVGHAAPR